MIAVVLGTRPEAIKLAPVVHALREQQLSTSLVITGQHRDLVRPALASFGLEPDTDLDVPMTRDLSQLTAHLLASLGEYFSIAQPTRVVVHGDTATTLAATLAAFYDGIPVAHVEAGLRTGDLQAPFPEEANRVLVDHLATWLFAPTPRAAAALRAEGHPEPRIHMTGNTGVDAVLWMRDHGITTSPKLPSQPWVVVTAHRRESIPHGLARIASAVVRLAEQHRDITWVVPLHPNPAVRDALAPDMASLPNVRCLDPLPYPDAVRLISGAKLVLTDSGGLQEEAPTLGVPVIVLRDKTERVEGVDAGWLQLAGTDPDRIVALTATALAAPPVGLPLPFGDGQAAKRIAAELAR